MGFFSSIIASILKQLTLLIGILTGKPVTPPVIPPGEQVVYPIVTEPVEGTSKLPALKDGNLSINDPALDRRILAAGNPFGFTGAGACSGVYITVSADPVAPVYFVTNGHCVADPYQAPLVYTSIAMSGSEGVNFKFLKDNEAVSVPVKKVPYYTMKGTDLAVVELNTTHAAMKAQGIEPLSVAQAPVQGVKMAVYGYPQLVGEDSFTLRQSSCQVEKPRDIIEGQWTWFNSYQNACTDIVGGSSGSPVISNIDRGVWGLINTTTHGAEGFTPCMTNAPCNWLDSSAPVITPNRNYVVGLWPLKGCFTIKGIFDLSLASCGLEKPADFKVTPAEADPSSPVYSTAAMKGKTLDFTLSSTERMSYKLVAAKSFNRSDNSGFTAINSTAFKVPFPVKDGEYILTIKKGNNLAQAVRFPFTMTSTGPTASMFDINFRIFPNADVMTLYGAPDPHVLGLGAFRFYSMFNTPDGSCPADTSVYQSLTTLSVIQTSMSFTAAQLPATTCVVVSNSKTGLYSSPKKYVLTIKDYPELLDPVSSVE